MMWLVLISAFVLLIYYKLIKALSYWKERGIAYVKPLPLIRSFYRFILHKVSFFDYVQDIYTQFNHERFFGAYQFNKPVLYIRDIDLIRKITIKDFDHFTDHSSFLEENVEPLMDKNLFNLKGQRWRNMRATLSPSFSSSKMKMMFILLSDCAQEFTKYFKKQSGDVLAVEMKDAFTKFTNDAIASVAFGLKCDSLEDATNEFYLMGKKATTLGTLRSTLITIIGIFPKLGQMLNIGFFPASVRNFFYRIVEETIKHREAEGLVRPDMIHLLMEARKGRYIEEDNITVDAGFASTEETKEHCVDTKRKLELTNEDITAQALIFFFGGFETSATLMSFLAYEIAVNSDVQVKLQKEIDETLSACNGNLTYEGLHKMKYMDMVVSECLRKWPPGFQLDRLCVHNYTIEPPVDTNMKPFVIEKGTGVIIPVIGIHRDPKYFPNPEKFDPERFNDENKHNIVPCSYLPFGSGPRNCIASRFALMENKTIIFHVLSKFDIVPIEKTPIPLIVGKGSFNLGPQKGFWLGLKPRRDVKLI
ncbi:hypothetical protein FQA39_LY18240 [Lamprigera yunnana]|nr:hypothetical protein FQA39_LY18240 [Lamprigera yunnana]